MHQKPTEGGLGDVARHVVPLCRCALCNVHGDQQQAGAAAEFS
jgi:hypothetical protein